MRGFPVRALRLFLGVSFSTGRSQRRVALRMHLGLIWPHVYHMRYCGGNMMCRVN